MRRRLIIKRKLVRQRRLNAVSPRTECEVLFPRYQAPLSWRSARNPKRCQSGIKTNCREY